MLNPFNHESSNKNNHAGFWKCLKPPDSLIFWVVKENKLRSSILFYYGFMYLLMPDLIFTIDRRRSEEEEAVKSLMEANSKWHVILKAFFAD